MRLDKLTESPEEPNLNVCNSFTDEIEAVISAFRSVISLEELDKYGIKPVYTSSPITTGKRIYEILEKCKVKNIDEIMRSNPYIKKEIMRENIKEGIEFGKEVRKSGFPIVIIPSIFFAKGWAQEHYMSLWKYIIEQKSRIVVYNDNFHYSDGCVEEFLIGLKSDKELKMQKDMKRLIPREEIKKIEKAMEDINRITGVIPKKIYDSYQEIVKIVQ